MTEPVEGPARCEHAGCAELAVEVYLPDWGEGAGEPYYYCWGHLRENGWCPGCLNFWGGIESFDFSRSGYCENCAVDVEEDYADDDYWFA